MNLVFKDFEQLSDKEIINWIKEIFPDKSGLSDEECVVLLWKMVKSTEEQFFKEESNE